MKTEFSKWLSLFGLLAAIAIVLYLFLTRGPAILAEFLSSTSAVLLIAMTQWGDQSIGNKIFIVFIGILIALSVIVFGVALFSTR